MLYTRLLLTSLFVLGFATRGSADVHLFSYTAALTSAQSLTPFVGVLRVYEEDVSVRDVALVPDSMFQDSSQWTPTEKPPAYIWMKVRIANVTDVARSDYMYFQRFHDTVDVYKVVGEQLVHLGRSGRVVDPAQKDIPHYYNYVAFVLPPHDTVTYFARVTFNAGTISYRDHSNHWFLFDGTRVIHRTLSRFSTQALYGGIMLLFCLVSLFMFISFKERFFVFYAALMLFLNLYFADREGLLAAYVFYYPTEHMFYESYIAISGIVYFGYWFISEYLTLSTSAPRLKIIYHVLSAPIAIYAISLGFGLREALREVSIIESLLNVLLIIWITFTLFVVVKQAFTKSHPARVLALSVLMLIGGALMYTLALLGVINVGTLGQTGFQIGTIAFSGTLFYGLFSRITQIQRERLSFQAEKEQADALLFNILPAEVAIELKESGKSEAKQFDSATVIFTDFKDFTSISSTLSAAELVDEINVCFGTFDTIIQRYNIEKIKTIGDSYMAVGGIQGSKLGSPLQAVRAALAMQDFIVQHSHERSAKGLAAFKMRVGLHTGPVVAGIIGIKKLQYDIWGDTVNTASRMESNGEVGRVNISEATYNLVCNEAELTFTSRGEIEVKGKGFVKMWFVSSQ